MKQLKGLFISLALLVLTNTAWAAEGSITITSPANNAVLADTGGNKLAFNTQLSPNGNHVHIYVDDQAPIVFRDVGHCPCNVELPNLAPGKHTITVKEATSGHAMTGVQSSVTVTVK